MHLKANNIYFINESLHIKYDLKLIEIIKLETKDRPRFLKQNVIRCDFHFYLNDKELPKIESANVMETEGEFDLNSERVRKYLTDEQIDIVKVSDAFASLSISLDPSNQNINRLRTLATNINKIFQFHPFEPELLISLTSKAACRKSVKKLLENLAEKGTLENDD